MILCIKVLSFVYFSDNSENSPNGELTVQKEENPAESTAICVQSEAVTPTCQEETVKTDDLELANPVTEGKAIEFGIKWT